MNTLKKISQNYNFNKVVLVLLCLVFTSVKAQYVIVGNEQTTVGATENYVFQHTNGSPLFGNNIDYFWYTFDSSSLTITESGSNEYQEIDDPDISVIWNTQGVHTLEIEVIDGFSNFYYHSIPVTVVANVAMPTAPTIESNNCGNTVLQRGMPPTGVTWYWQDSATGTSTSNSSSTITLTSGTEYYLRARDDAGNWSANSSSVTYMVLEYSECTDTGFLSNENYIYTLVPRIETTETDSLSNDEKIENVQYFDGLGRPMQTIAIGGGGQSQDVVSHVEYDSLGRQSKEYLPYTVVDNSGRYRANPLTELTSFYNQTKYDNTTNYYSEKNLEASPLNRVLEQAAPGADWVLDKDSDTDHTIKFEYGVNTNADGVYQFNVTLALTSGIYEPTLTLRSSSENSSFYDEYELYKTVIKDENWTSGRNHTIEEYKNRQGQAVLKRTFADVTAGGVTIPEVAHDTYFVYDIYGNLTYVLPPKVNLSDGVSIGDNSELSELCYQYKYDDENRLVERKIPGKGWEYIVYDKLNRPVLTQDAILRADKDWLFTKYDALGRVILTGKYTHGTELSQSGMQAYFETNNETAANQFEEAQDTDAETGAFYSNNNFPNTNIELFAINYYDSYIDTPDGFTIPTTVFDESITNTTKGLTTVSKVKVLDTNISTNNWITTVACYDEKARPIYVYIDNPYLQTVDIVKTQLDFTGNTLKTRSNHTKGTLDVIVVQDVFTYDHANRLIDQHQCIGDINLDETCGEGDGIYSIYQDTEDLDYEVTVSETFIANQTIRLLNGFSFEAAAGKVLSASIFKSNETGELIAENTFDDLGQLVSKKVGNSKEAPLQSIDYTYNIRGWLEQINDPNNLGTDLFGFEIGYNQGINPLYNGNISSTQWSSGSANDTGNLVSSMYDYTYDALNRIKTAIDNTGNYNLNSISYDKNGNILSLSRQGYTNTAITSFGVMDDLTYSYGLGNKLTNVSDAGAITGFKEGNTSGDDYSYDANGNMISDNNKNISSINYNHLNLPTLVTVNDSIGNPKGTIAYVYNSLGIKLQKTVTEGSNVTITKYANGYMYTDDQLQFINIPEGYTSPKDANDITQGFRYVYQYKDHLGNVRVSYTGTHKDSLSIVEEKNYYPFGLQHKGYNSATNPNLGNSLAQKFGYNGIELEESMGFNLYEMDLRSYDPTIARFNGMDPVIHLSQGTSVAFDNNPVYWADPSGADSKVIHDTKGKAWSVDCENGECGDAKEVENKEGDHRDHVNSAGGLRSHDRSQEYYHEGSGAALAGWYTKKEYREIVYGVALELMGADGVISNATISWLVKMDDKILEQIANVRSNIIGAIEYPMTGHTIPMDIDSPFFAPGILFKLNKVRKYSTFAFWSGKGAEYAAIASGFKVIGQTRAGVNLAKLTKGMLWGVGTQSYKYWGRLSKAFAKTIPRRGTVHVFLTREAAENASSIWNVFEKPVLLENKVNIIINWVD